MNELDDGDTIEKMTARRDAQLAKVDELTNALLGLQDQVTATLGEIRAARHLIALYNETLTSVPRTP